VTRLGPRLGGRACSGRAGAGQDLRIHVADLGVLVYVLLLRAWVVRLAVRGRWHRGRCDR